MKSFLGIKYDKSKVLKQMEKSDEQKRKVDEMYRVKHRLFDYIHQRIRSYGKSHKSQKLGWYKRRWGNEITQYYFDNTTKKVKGDLDRIIRKLNDELIRVQNLSKKNFKTSFSHKVPKYKQRIQKEMNSERNDVVVNLSGKFTTENNADYIISLVVNTVPRSEELDSYGFYYVYANAELSIISSVDNKQLYSKSITQVKGGHPDLKLAGNQALKKLLKEIKSELPKLVEQL